MRPRPALQQHLVVHHLHMKQVSARLQVCDARLPVQVEQIDHPDVDVAKPPCLAAVPYHHLAAGAVLDLVPPCIVVHLLIPVLLQHHRQDRTQLPGRLGVVLRPRQYVWLRVVVHRVRVLVGKGVEQPRRIRRIVQRHLRAVALVVQPVPLLIVDDLLVQCLLPLLVLLQSQRRLPHLLHPDRPLYPHRPGLFILNISPCAPSVGGGVLDAPPGSHFPVSADARHRPVPSLLRRSGEGFPQGRREFSSRTFPHLPHFVHRHFPVDHPFLRHLSIPPFQAFPLGGRCRPQAADEGRPHAARPFSFKSSKPSFPSAVPCTDPTGLPPARPASRWAAG